MLPAPFNDALVLTGPTASGKTALGIELAERMGVEIISMDSMAVYRGMDIGTAKVDADGRRRVRHHMIDVLDPWESSSVAWWLKRAADCCREIASRGKRVLFVGGTPLYLKGLLYGLFSGPPRNPAMRQELETEAASHGAEVLHDRLRHVDPETAARVHPNDRRRVIRALEIWKLTGRPISIFQKQWQAPQSDCRVLCLDLPRAELYARIEARVREMIAGGLVEEARRLCALPRPLSREAMQAVGYKEVFDYLEGVRSLDDTVTRIQTRSRQFAKRQLTWFRHLAPVRMVSPIDVRLLGPDNQ
jgi:tRNA dimethylallyltransferase